MTGEPVRVSEKIYFWYDENGVTRHTPKRKHKLGEVVTRQRRTFGMRIFQALSASGKVLDCIAVAVATCALKDNFDKKLGREIVGQRLNDVIKKFPTEWGEGTRCAGIINPNNLEKDLAFFNQNNRFHGKLDMKYIQKLYVHWLTRGDHEV